MKTYAIKYLELAEKHAEKIAEDGPRMLRVTSKHQFIKVWMKKLSSINASGFIKISARCSLMRKLQMMY